VTQTATRPEPRGRAQAADARRPAPTAAPPRPAAPTAPPRYKLALVTWLGAYAVITGLLALLGPVMASWTLPLRTLLLSALMVVALPWAVMPALNKVFRAWLTS
jgi:uncharacterized protein